jgi:hypothetical protein
MTGSFFSGAGRTRLKVVQSFASVRSKKNLMPQMAMVAVLRE